MQPDEQAAVPDGNDAEAQGELHRQRHNIRRRRRRRFCSELNLLVMKYYRGNI